MTFCIYEFRILRQKISFSKEILRTFKRILFFTKNYKEFFFLKGWVELEYSEKKNREKVLLTGPHHFLFRIRKAQISF